MARQRTSTRGHLGGESGRSSGARPSDDELLASACVVFAEAGFRGAAMEAIADAAGTSKPTLYAHFSNKDQLYRACLQREAEKLTHWLFTTYAEAASLPAAQQVRADMRAFFDYARAYPDGFRLLFNDHTAAGAFRIREELVNTITDRVAERIRDVVAHHDSGETPRASADLLAAMVVGIAVHGARHALLAHPVDLDQAGELASALAYAGMRNLDPELMRVLDSETPH